MVQHPSLGKIWSGYEIPPNSAPAVELKLEVEDALDDEHGPFNKRPKLECPSQPVPSKAARYNLLSEPSPLGLRLRKSPSLLDLIQMKILQGNSTAPIAWGNKDARSSSGFGSSEKLKAANFRASLLRIGDWECTSTYEGDLVVKFYFAKRKLVWEVLDGGLKNKIEIRWSDITALKATCPENGVGTLDIVLGRRPLLFRETNPQPRKHTLWQATPDFTGGQASIHRRHFVECPQGLLNKHFEKLIQSDPHLYSLSLLPNIILENPYFQPRCSVLEHQGEPRCHGFDSLNNGCPLQHEGFQDLGTMQSMSSSCGKTEIQDCGDRTANVMPQNYPLISATGTRFMDESATGEAIALKDLGHCGQFKVPKLSPSICANDSMNCIGHQESEQIPLGCEQISDVLDELAQYFYNDSPNATVADEKSLMSRVNSFLSLIQKDATTNHNLQIDPASSLGGEGAAGVAASYGEPDDAPGLDQSRFMARKDSFGELLMNLPRIASLSQFSVNRDEGDEAQDDKMDNRHNYM